MPHTLISEDIAGRAIPPRRSGSRKGDNGKVLVVGGSYIYHGAPILASLAALRTGCDLVYTAVPKVNAQATRAASPSLIAVPLPDQKLTKGSARKLLGMIPSGIDSAAIGMGLAIADRTALEFLAKSLLDRDVRLVLDASSLVRDILPHLAGSNAVLTPHAGEFQRMFGEAVPPDTKGRIQTVMRFAKEYRVAILLKGQTDIVCDGERSYAFAKKIPAMTVGGTGDVLAGITAGILAKNRDAALSAAAAAYVNGTAGQLIQDELGLHIMPTDLIGAIPRVMKKFDKIE